MPEILQNEQSSLRVLLQKHCDYRLEKQTTLYNAEKCASDVKKMKDRRKQNFEGEVNNMQLDKEDTRRSN